MRARRRAREPADRRAGHRRDQRSDRPSDGEPARADRRPDPDTRPRFPAGLYAIRPSLQHPGGVVELLEPSGATLPKVEIFGVGWDVHADLIVGPTPDVSGVTLYSPDGTSRQLRIPGLFGVGRPSLSPDGKRVFVQGTETRFDPASGPRTLLDDTVFIAAATYFGGTAGGIQAIVAAAGYSRVDDLRTMPPVLILQGTADRQIPVSQAHQFEDALKRAGIAVEAEYAAGAPHSYLFDQATHAPAIARATAFLKKTLP